jgi:hypothetical protein
MRIRSEGRFSASASDGGDAVHVRHPQVEQHNVGSKGFDLVYSGTATAKGSAKIKSGFCADYGGNAFTNDIVIITIITRVLCPYRSPGSGGAFDSKKSGRSRNFKLTLVPSDLSRLDLDAPANLLSPFMHSRQP